MDKLQNEDEFEVVGRNKKKHKHQESSSEDEFRVPQQLVVNLDDKNVRNQIKSKLAEEIESKLPESVRKMALVRDNLQ